MNEQMFTMLVTGPCRASTASLIQSISQSAVVSAGAAHGAMHVDVGIFDLDDGEVRLRLFGTQGRPHSPLLADELRGEVDIVAVVIDASAPSTHAAARVELRSALADSNVPAVLVVDRCDDLGAARSVARSLGATADQPVVPCQLGNSDSGRDAVLEVLMTRLAHIEVPGRFATGPVVPSPSQEVEVEPHSWV